MESPKDDGIKRPIEKPYLDPKTCLHLFPQVIERWYGNGKYTTFVCKECNATIRPVWQVVEDDNASGA